MKYVRQLLASLAVVATGCISFAPAATAAALNGTFQTASCRGGGSTYIQLSGNDRQFGIGQSNSAVLLTDPVTNQDPIAATVITPDFFQNSPDLAFDSVQFFFKANRATLPLTTVSFSFLDPQGKPNGIAGPINLICTTKLVDNGWYVATTTAQKLKALSQGSLKNGVLRYMTIILRDATAFSQAAVGDVRIQNTRTAVRPLRLDTQDLGCNFPPYNGN